MKRTISGYILSSLLLLCSAAGYSQDEPKPVTVKGLRLGVDLSNMVVHQILPERQGWEVAVDYQWNKYWFIATEFGRQTVDANEPTFNYDLRGSYVKMGFDYDVLKSLRTDDVVGIGMRYGTSVYKHSAGNIVINNYWGDLQGAISEGQFNAHWLELVFSVKAELFFLKNVFLGWSIRTGIYMFGERDERMDAFIIPGYGAGEKNLTVTYNWTVSYRIPFKKDVVQPKVKK